MVGIAGITLLINYCVTEMQGVAEGIASTLGITLNVIDGGYGAIPYYGYVELLFPALACIIVLDIIMIGLGWTKVLWVDIHNTWHGLFVGLIAYAITDDYGYRFDHPVEAGRLCCSAFSGVQQYTGRLLYCFFRNYGRTVYLYRHEGN